jgi:hypothetical protein
MKATHVTDWKAVYQNLKAHLRMAAPGLEGNPNQQYSAWLALSDTARYFPAATSWTNERNAEFKARAKELLGTAQVCAEWAGRGQTAEAAAMLHRVLGPKAASEEDEDEEAQRIRDAGKTEDEEDEEAQRIRDAGKTEDEEDEEEEDERAAARILNAGRRARNRR